MHRYNFNTDRYKPGPICQGKYCVEQRGIMLVPEVPVGRQFTRADGTSIKVLSIAFEADVYTIEIYSTVSIKRMLTTSKQLVKKLTDESWKIVK